MSTMVAFESQASFMVDHTAAIDKNLAVPLAAQFDAPQAAPQAAPLAVPQVVSPETASPSMSCFDLSAFGLDMGTVAVACHTDFVVRTVRCCNHFDLSQN